MNDVAVTHEDENTVIDAYWEHPRQGKWVLYRHIDPDTGQSRGFYEFRENRNQSHKPSNHYREYDGRGRYEERVDLLQQNRSAFNRATCMRSGLDDLGGLGDL